ncbi:putative F-box domain, kelch-type beta propeller, F-box-like domain superfamily [Arabidopsis thaliana]
MVELSEIPGDPNGADPNNNPQEEDEEKKRYITRIIRFIKKKKRYITRIIRFIKKKKRYITRTLKNKRYITRIFRFIKKKKRYNENPQEQKIHNENLPILLQLPEELIERIIAHFPQCYSPSPILVCKTFRRVIISDHFYYVTRSLLSFTKPVLYALIAFQAYTPPSWFFLRQSNIALQLHRIRSFPIMLSGAAVVTIGYKIFHTWKSLPDMQRARCHAAAGVIDGRIYVIGGREPQDADWVEVFDVTTESWETVPTQCPNEASENGLLVQYVVIQGKIFILDLDCCFAYEPVQGLWESWDDGSELMRFWHSSSSCVVGDLLYALDLTCALEHPIVVYYPNELVWRPVMGVDTAHLPILCEYRSTLANFDGKLVILGGGDCSESSSEIWCVEIALETRQGDQIWGVVKSVSIVSRDLPMRHVIELCRTVMV